MKKYLSESAREADDDDEGEVARSQDSTSK
jgi:hypothetical protein